MSKKTIYFDRFCDCLVSAVTEDGKAEEFNFEKKSGGCAIGDIFKGVVESVHPGMQACFINCGLEKNCFLSDEPLPDDAGNGVIPRNMPDLKAGDEVMVQIVKLPAGNKGAKVTLNLSFVGKTLIYMPDCPFVGVSRKIGDEELRLNLAFAAKRLISGNEGLIVRTAAPYVRRSKLKDEFIYLKNLYKGISEKFSKAEAGALLYNDVSLPVRVLRDTLSTDIDCIYAGNAELKDEIETLVNLYPSEHRRPVILHDTGRDMFEDSGLTEQILSIASPKVELENGAYIVIEYTEALTVIDVNTGKFTGDYNLEQTVYHTNVLAAREIARQVKLRNIGGIVVVDFIDMQNEKHRKALAEELERALKDDKAKCVVSPMSQFGLIEFTRKRMSSSPLSQMIKPCKNCGQHGFVKSPQLLLFGIRAKVLGLISDGARRLKIDLNADLCARFLENEPLKRELLSHGAEIYLVPHKTYQDELIKYRADDFPLPDDAVKL